MKQLFFALALTLSFGSLMAQNQFFSPLNANPVGPNGPATNKARVVPYCCPSDAIEISSTVAVGENDFQWVNIPLNGIAAGMVSRLVVCYQVVGAGGSYISQLRLAEMSAPNSAVVKVDDPTDLNSTAATCYATKAGYVVGGTTTLSLKVVLKPGDKIIVGGISVIR